MARAAVGGSLAALGRFYLARGRAPRAALGWPPAPRSPSAGTRAAPPPASAPALPAAAAPTREAERRTAH
eukprot:283366-Prymnesium_polylepis.1